MRLTRRGRKKRPTYRVVVAEVTAPRDGKFVEILGRYEPLEDPPVFEVKAERVQYWLSQGAQPTATVHRFLAKQGLTAPLVAKPRSKRADAKRAAALAAASASPKTAATAKAAATPKTAASPKTAATPKTAAAAKTAATPKADATKDAAPEAEGD